MQLEKETDKKHKEKEQGKTMTMTKKKHDTKRKRKTKQGKLSRLILSPVAQFPKQKSHGSSGHAKQSCIFAIPGHMK